MITNLTTKQIESIQIDEGIIFLNYGEANQQFLAPTRGGGEFAATVTVRDIEFDGRHGKTAGMQVIEEQGASLKVTTIGLTQENLAASVPTATVGADAGKTVKNPKTGYIAVSNYLKNVTMFCKTIGGQFKKIVIYNAMHETGFGFKAAQKAEGELALEILAHYKHEDLDGDLWEVSEATSYADPRFVEAATATSTKVAVTFNEELDPATLTYSDFEILQSDATKAISAAALKTGDAKVVELTVATLTSGKTLTVSYTKGTLKGANGQSVESFSKKPIDNTL